MAATGSRGKAGEGKGDHILSGIAIEAQRHRERQSGLLQMLQARPGGDGVERKTKQAAGEREKQEKLIETAEITEEIEANLESTASMMNMLEQYVEEEIETMVDEEDEGEMSFREFRMQEANGREFGN